MKKFLTVLFSIAIIVTLIGCSKSKSHGDDQVMASIDNVPVLVNRAIMTDAVWGVGEGIPADINCVAFSQFSFSADGNPFVIVKNTKDDPYFVTPAVVVSSLNLNLPSSDVGQRDDTCSAGDLYYLISASPEIPIDVEVVGENCPSLADIATADGVGFPASGSVTAHFEAEEVDLLANDCAEPESAPPSDEVSEPTDTGNPETPQVQPAEPTEDECDPTVENCDTVEEEVVEEDVVQEEVVEEEVVEEEVVEDECNPYFEDCVIVEDTEDTDEVVEEIVEDECDPDVEDCIIVEDTEDSDIILSQGKAATYADANGGCGASMPVKMFKLVIDSCSTGDQGVDVVAE